MNVKELTEHLDLTILSGERMSDTQVRGGYCSDLLSDIMGKADEGYVWITLQTHKNIMAVASLKELAAIIIVNGLTPDEEVLSLSKEEGIPVLGTSLPAFDIAGKLYQLLHQE